MGGIVGGSKSPPPPMQSQQPQFVAAPTKDTAEVQADAMAERQRIAAASGRRSTLLAGTSDEAAPDRKKVLLGG